MAKIGDTEVKGGIQTTVTNIDPETGQISWDVEYSADYQNWNILDSGIVSEGVEQSRFLPAPKGLVRIVEER